MHFWMDILKNPALTGVIGTMAGICLKSFVDWISSNYRDRKEFRRKIRFERINDLLNQFPILIEEAKIQIQELEYIYHDSYWISKGLKKEDLKIKQDIISKRSGRIIELKELCTIDVIAFKPNQELIEILDEIVDILDEDMPEFFNKHILLTTDDHNYLADLNDLRSRFIEELRKELKN